MEVFSKKDEKLNHLYQFGSATFLSGFFYNVNGAMLTFLIALMMM